MPQLRINRRQFLMATAVLGSGLALRFNSEANAAQLFDPNASADAFAVSDQWIHIGTDNLITIKIPSSEMGQGIHTGLALIVAEELDADWDTIRLQQAPLSSEFKNPIFGSQITGGSTSTQAFWEPMRTIGASARAMLIQAAAHAWQVKPNQIKTNNGELIGPESQQQRYGDFASAAARLPVPGKVTLKDKQAFRLIGKATKRIDSTTKIDGSAEFGIDVVRPDMLIAAVKHAPVFGSEIDDYNEKAAKSVRGVEAVVPMGDAIAVLARDYWTARKGLDVLQAEFKQQGAELGDSDAIYVRLRSELDDEGKYEFEDNANTLDLEYQVPFLAHATMEPMNCTAHVQADRCDVWAPTQGQTTAGDVAEAITGLDRDQIYINTTYLGGGFGRRAESDFVAEAVTLSKAVNKPVKVIWSREEDIQHDFYRPACISRIQVQLNDTGKPIAWHNQFAAPSIFKRIFARSLPFWFPAVHIFGDPVASEGASPPYLNDDSVEIDYVVVDTSVPVGFWRSVGHSYNAFFVESAIDEIAHKAKTDPYLYRRNLLQQHPRLLNVLELAAQHSNWGKTNHHQGIAVHASFNSFVAQVVELSVDANKNITLHRIVCAVDCGIAINPDAVVAQMQGGIVFGLSAALDAEITIKNGRVMQSNFHDYPVLRLNQCPLIDVVLVDSNETPSGVGEPGTPPIAPALCNAIFAATGERLRQLPIASAGYHLQA
ncbi:MAG: xanthine dehydrogenase family protein molybdopterin-binding subunit [Gammaproteobacteria bacterium]|nr:xanthine dehydrogenase family protein molybdopterin-binding subunit [Gammaproteobacteria bacterium]